MADKATIIDQHLGDGDFYASLAKLAEEVVAEVEAATKGMTAIERKEYFLRGARDHLAKLHELKAADVLIEQAEQRIARLTKELADLKSADAPAEGEAW